MDQGEVEAGGAFEGGRGGGSNPSREQASEAGLTEGQVLRPAPGPNRPQGNLRTCFACGQQGHFMRNCPSAVHFTCPGECSSTTVQDQGCLACTGEVIHDYLRHKFDLNLSEHDVAPNQGNGKGGAAYGDLCNSLNQ